MFPVHCLEPARVGAAVPGHTAARRTGYVGHAGTAVRAGAGASCCWLAALAAAAAEAVARGHHPSGRIPGHPSTQRNSRCCPPTRSPRRKRVPRRAGSGAGGSPSDGGSRRAPRIEPRVRYRANEPRASVWWPRPPARRGGLQHGVAGTRRRMSNRRRPLRRRPTRSRELDSRPELRTRLLGLASPRQEATTPVGGGGCRCRHGPGGGGRRVERLPWPGGGRSQSSNRVVTVARVHRRGRLAVPDLE
jgi:hypothetical protein